MAGIVWTKEKVEEILLIAQDVISLDMPISSPDSDTETELGAMLEDTAPNPEELALINGRREKLFEYMTRYLKPREIEVLQMRYGFTTGTPITLEEIGKRFGITRERVRQIELRALRTLRYRLYSNNITKEDM